MKKHIQIIQICVAAALVGGSAAAWASGFALIEQNASGLGNAFAGQAAAAEDASTIFFNPAGLTRLQGGNFAGALHAITPSMNFTNTGSAVAAPHALNGTGGDAGSLVLVPNGYLSWQMGPSWWIGVGLSVPFGLKTEYDANWTGRFQGVKSDIKTVDINPTIAFKLNDTVSIGAGVSWQKVDAEFTRAVNLGATEGTARIEGDDTQWGFNLGVMFNFGPNTRIGASYRSSMGYQLSGTATILSAAGAPVAGTPVAISANARFPDTFSLAYGHVIDENWEILTDVTYTRWSTIKSVPIIRLDTGAPLDTFNLQFNDTWRAGIGANRKISKEFTLKLGFAYDQSPVSDTFRTVRLPDNDRTWVSIGGKYSWSKASSLDFGYAHLFVRNASINNVQGVAGGQNGNVIGNFDNKVDIVSIQFSHGF